MNITGKVKKNNDLFLDCNVDNFFIDRNNVRFMIYFFFLRVFKLLTSTYNAHLMWITIF